MIRQKGKKKGGHDASLAGGVALHLALLITAICNPEPPQRDHLHKVRSSSSSTALFAACHDSAHLSVISPWPWRRRALKRLTMRRNPRHDAFPWQDWVEKRRQGAEIAHDLRRYGSIHCPPSELQCVNAATSALSRCYYDKRRSAWQTKTLGLVWDEALDTTNAVSSSPS